MQWTPYAMVRATAVFIAGILGRMYLPGLLTESSTVGLFITLLLTYYLVRFSVQNNSLRICSGFTGLASVFIAGYCVVLLNDDASRPDNLLRQESSFSAFEVKVISPCEEKEKSWKRTAEVTRILTESGWRKVTGMVNLYWPKSEPVSSLDFGDVLLIQGMPSPVEPPQNPGEFDLKYFLSLKHIYHQHFIRSGTWRIVRRSDDRGFLFYAQRARNWSVAAIKKFIRAPREEAILSALVLGVTDGLDGDLRSAYAANGAMHVLAVSGLHVSIIYGIIMFFFRPLEKVKGGPWIMAFTSLILLWAYAFITGLSPSVLRAVAMFSFVAIAKPMNRVTNIYNTLAASAFFLLMYDPLLILSVGFQLSYLAVIGIVALQRPIYNLWEARSSIMDWIWQISSVSLAAQIATVSLTLFYFHQFPIYFLLANLFIIPASFVVLVGGILLLAVSPLVTVAGWLGTLLEWFVKIVNEGVFLVERLPFSLMEGIYISQVQCFVLFAFIISGLVLLHSRKFRFVLFMALFAVAFSWVEWNRMVKQLDSEVLAIYRVSNHQAMEWMVNGQSLFVADSLLTNDKGKIGFHISPGRVMRGVARTTSFPTGLRRAVGGMELYRRKGRTFLVVHSDKTDPPVLLKADYLIISNNSIKSLQTFAKHVKFDHVILDSSNSYRYCEHMSRQADEMSISCVSVLKDGALTLKL